MSDKDGSGAIERIKCFLRDEEGDGDLQTTKSIPTDHHSVLVKKYQSLCSSDPKSEMALRTPDQAILEGCGHSVEQGVAQRVSSDQEGAGAQAFFV